MFISRREAEQKYKISYTRLRQLEKKGKLTPIDASTVRYELRNKHGGNTVKVVYDEAQLVALKGKTSFDARFARGQRRDALVFDMLAEGVDVPDIVRRTRLDVPVVLRLRDTYVREKEGFVVPGEARRIARKHGFEIGPHNIVEVLIRLLEYGRGVKPPKERLSRVKVIPDE
jgi:hypothetical protein